MATAPTTMAAIIRRSRMDGVYCFMHAEASETINMPAPYPDQSQAGISASTSLHGKNLGSWGIMGRAAPWEAARGKTTCRPWLGRSEHRHRLSASSYWRR